MLSVITMAIPLLRNRLWKELLKTKRHNKIWTSLILKTMNTMSLMILRNSVTRVRPKNMKTMKIQQQAQNPQNQ